MRDDPASTMMLKLQRIWPRCTPLYSGTAESGAYTVQPAREAPASTNRLASMISPDAAAVQNDAMLSRGNAMSGAPIFSGIR